MPRIAWFGSLPPIDSGAAATSAAALPRLAGIFRIDAYVEQAGAAEIRGVTILAADDFVARHLRSPYDAIVYHVSADPADAYVSAYLTHAPGLLVLHTLELHDARRDLLIRTGRADRYLAELEFAHPDGAAIANTTADPLLRSLIPVVWPTRRALLARARAVAVHDHHAAGIIGAEAPGIPLLVVSSGIVAPALPSRATARDRLGIPQDACVFASLDPIGWAPHERAVLEMFARVSRRKPQAWLVLAGASSSDSSRAPALGAHRAGEPTARNVIDLVLDTPEDRWALRAAADVGLQINWPTGAHDAPDGHVAWLASGRPVITLDRAPTARWPLLSPHAWKPTTPAIPGLPAAPPVGVAVPVNDELHSLQRAMERLAEDADLRAALGRAAAEWASVEAGPERVADAYRAAIEATVSAPMPAPMASLPEALRER